MQKLLLSLIGLFAIVGCETVPISPNAQFVRTITPAVATSCEHLGITESFEPGIAGGIGAAQLQVRNKAVQRGGDSIIIISQSIETEYRHGRVIAEIYKCKL